MRDGAGLPSMADARRVLGSVFGFEAFRPGQAAVIEALPETGSDALSGLAVR